MNRTKLTVIGIAAVGLAILGFSAIFTVHQTEQALILQFGNPKRVVREPGINLKVPLIQNVEYFDRRILALDPDPEEILLTDQKRIRVDAFARFRILDPLEFRKRAVTIPNFINLFGRLLNSAVRSEVAQVSLADMLSERRAVVMSHITDDLKSQAPNFGIEVVDVRIGRTDLPEVTSDAVYSRMRSEREAQATQLRAEGERQKAQIQATAERERTVILADANKTAQILRGEGDAARTMVLTDAYGRDPAFFDFYRSLEAYSALQGDDTTLVLSPDADFFRFFFNESGEATKSER